MSQQLRYPSLLSSGQYHNDAPRGCNSFTCGLVAGACISAFQDVTDPTNPAQLKRVLRHALQGGTALAAGSRASAALQRGDYSGVLTATAMGAAGVMIIERLLRDAPPSQALSTEVNTESGMEVSPDV